MSQANIQLLFRKRFVRFLAGGGLATLIHWLVMFALIQRGTDPRISTAAGASAGLAVNYLLQYRYTFRSGLPHRVAFSRYLGGSGLGWILNLSAFSLLYAATDITMVAQGFATLTTMLANYLLAERFVFHEKIADQPQ